MKAALALFLSLIMFVGGLMPHNDVEELGKLPQLLEHFQYHQTPQGGSMSFRQFLSAHYNLGGSTIQQCPPSTEHDQLPLHGQHRLPNLEYVVPATRLLTQQLPLSWRTAAYRLASPPRYLDAEGAALLQPPRA
ncbi:hypothetical protein [Hymenobacter sp. YC55]|uniref:hypothetical protein n=1 Tax=Hymenobacter sp. YC55 TaxID=3034019 RepID=UPI0023F6BA1A|nr:hypothetical protein [Hymenobacter sp. YC55]MDF7815787.1 hypothetical protein [Hymenobacter sp. YC55]